MKTLENPLYSLVANIFLLAFFNLAIFACSHVQKSIDDSAEHVGVIEPGANRAGNYAKASVVDAGQGQNIVVKTHQVAIIDRAFQIPMATITIRKVGKYYMMWPVIQTVWFHPICLGN